eukprot:5952971-Prymnesium_polylepis.2
MEVHLHLQPPQSAPRPPRTLSCELKFGIGRLNLKFGAEWTPCLGSSHTTHVHSLGGRTTHSARVHKYLTPHASSSTLKLQVRQLVSITP